MRLGLLGTENSFVTDVLPRQQQRKGYLHSFRTVTIHCKHCFVFFSTGSEVYEQSRDWTIITHDFRFKMADCSSFAARMTKPCRFFGTPSGCRFGNDCRFFHQITQPGRAEEHTGDRGGEATRERNEGDTSEVARTRSEADGARAKNDGNPKQLDALCRYFQRNGGCARGDNCHFAHVKSAAKKFKGPRLPRVKSKLKETPTDISEKTIPIMKKLVRQPDEEEVDRQQPVETASLQSVVSDVLRPCKEASNGHVQAVESILTNQHSENVDPEPDKPSSKHLTPFGKDGIKREAATDKNLAEFSKLRSMEIQLLKRRFGGRNGCFEEVLENVKFKVKFKPTDPDWVGNHNNMGSVLVYRYIRADTKDQSTRFATHSQ